MYPWRTEKVGGDQAHHVLDDGATSGKVNVDRQKDRRRDLRACLVITDTDINLATSLHVTVIMSKKIKFMMSAMGKRNNAKQTRLNVILTF
jgi:hypothetical protein